VTPRLNRIAATICVTLSALVFAPSALAAMEQGDAGDLRSTAQDLGDGAVSQIWGSFTNAEDADLYRVCLTDGASFSASTVGATTLDTQMFLLDENGFGVYANDDAGGTHGSRLPANHRFSPGSGGVYYLAISSFNRDPQSVFGEIFADIFNLFVYPDGVVDANGFGAAGEHVGWAGRAPGGPGLYRITVTGTRACVPPDTTAPAVDLRSPANGVTVRQGAELIVDFSCSDEGSSGLASCVGTTASGAALDTSELGPVSVTVTARDGAGNETVVTHTVTVVDETPPEIALTTPADGAVYLRGENVVADYSCADEPDGSGVEACTGTVANGAAVDTSTLGEHSFTVEASDVAGNGASRSVTYTVVDRTEPVVTLTTPAQGAVYGVGEQVLADYSCADEPGGSGVATCAGNVAAGAAIDTGSAGEKTFTVEAVDAAGNSASKSVTYTVVDRAAPGIAIATPEDGGEYELGARVFADYSCSDDAGVAKCEGTVPDGARIDTSKLGTKSFTVTATDGAGNSVSKTVSYRVVYDFDGFFWPVRNPPKVNKWKAGLPVPIVFSLDGYRGSHPEAPGYPRSARCDGGDREEARAASSRNRARSSHHRDRDRDRVLLVYERRSDRYVMLWKTERKWAGSCREFTLKLDDGSVHTARFEFFRR
jgi:hypothetical protein